MSLRLLPIPIKRALRWCKLTYRRLPKVTGGMWAIAVLRGDDVRGIAVVGRPNAQALESRDLPQPRLQVLRVAVLEGDASLSGHKGACSMLYAACARAARAMGCEDMWTYIHDDEPGTSLRAAGWIEDTEHESKGGSYDRPSRRRAAPVEGGRKVRWWAPWSASAPAHPKQAAGSTVQA